MPSTFSSRGEAKVIFRGVLEADSAGSGQFDLADADFLAGLLGIAIERQRADAELPWSTIRPNVLVPAP